MKSKDKKKSELDGLFFGIVANVHKNELSKEERLNVHLAITKKELYEILSEKFAAKGIKEIVIGHEHGEDDGYCHYQCYIQLEKRYKCRNNVPDVFDWGYINYQGASNKNALHNKMIINL